MNRRAFLGAAATGAVAGVAGCTAVESVLGEGEPPEIQWSQQFRGIQNGQQQFSVSALTILNDASRVAFTQLSDDSDGPFYVAEESGDHMLAAQLNTPSGRVVPGTVFSAFASADNTLTDEERMSRYVVKQRDDVATPNTPTATPTPTQTSTATPQAQPPDHLYGLRGATTPDESPGTFTRTFTQTFRGRTTEYTTNIPEYLFDYYDARARTANYGAYVSDTFDDDYIRRIAETFERYRKRNGMSQRSKVDHAIAFVQGMKYTSDVNEPFDEYPKYPVETLKDRGGDCEDTAILLASVLRKMGYGVVLLELPEKQHMAMGLKGDESIRGSYVTYEGDRYYYVETTGEGWRVGDIPDGYGGARTEVRTVNDHPSVTINWGANPANGGRVRVDMGLLNAGMAPAQSTQVKVFVMQQGRDDPVSGTTTDTFSIGVGQIRERSVRLRAPPDETLRLRFEVWVDGEYHDLTRSEWQEAA